MQAGSFTLSRRHREAEAGRSLGAPHGGKTSTKAGSLFRRHWEARVQEKVGSQGASQRGRGRASRVQKGVTGRLGCFHEGSREASSGG